MMVMMVIVNCTTKARQRRAFGKRPPAPSVASSVKVATLTLDATWSGFRTFRRFQNAPAVSECSGGFGMFWRF